MAKRYKSIFFMYSHSLIISPQNLNGRAQFEIVARTIILFLFQPHKLDKKNIHLKIFFWILYTQIIINNNGKREIKNKAMKPS